MTTPRPAAALAAGALLAIAACAAPPETQRVRGGDAGADIGNRGDLVKMHLGSEIFPDRRCAVQGADCTGPIPTTGRARDFVPAEARPDVHVLGEMGRGGAVRRVIYEPPPDLARPAETELEPPFPGPGT